MKYNHFIFDLDGTLVNSASEIYNSVKHICSENNLTIPDQEYIKKMTGSPPSEFFIDHGCRKEDTTRLVKEFRDHLKVHAGDQKNIFPGVIDLLQYISNNNYRISLATTKPTELAKTLLNRYGISKYFDHIQGTDSGLKHKPSPDIINICLEKAKKGKAVMIGDTIYDIKAANNAGIESIAITHGAHSEFELRNERPSCIVNNIRSLHEYLEENYG